MIKELFGVWNDPSLIMPRQATMFDRPVVLIHSDDWGRVGIRDLETLRRLTSSRDAGSDPYDVYTLETADDLLKLSELLTSHHDSTGRTPRVVACFVVANVDFPKTVASEFDRLYLKHLADGLPGRWDRPGLVKAYAQAIEAGVLLPALHGLTHFCHDRIDAELRARGLRGDMLRAFYQAETPYIYRLMSWVGYEYWDNGDGARQSFLSFDKQNALVEAAVDGFTRLFEVTPLSACAPGYRSNRDTLRAWASHGIRVVHAGAGKATLPYLGDFGLLHVQRNVMFEPCLDPALYTVDYALDQAERAFANGAPAVVCIHAVNFQSLLRNNRDTTLERLDAFLSALEARHGDLLYLDDRDLYTIATGGGYSVGGVAVDLKMRHRWTLPPALWEYMRRYFRTGPDESGER